MSAAFLISMENPFLKCTRIRAQMDSTPTPIFHQIGRLDYGKKSFNRGVKDEVRAWLLNYPSTSRTFRDKFFRVKGFCRNAASTPMFLR